MSKVKFLVEKKYYQDRKLCEVKEGDVVELPEDLEKAFIAQKICEVAGKKDNAPTGPTLTAGAKKLLKKYPDLDLSLIGQDRLDVAEIEDYIKENKIEPKK